MFEILFQNSIITVRSLNILLALGFVFTGIFGVRYATKHKMNLGFLTKFLIHIVLAALIIGRLAYVGLHLAEFESNYLLVLYLWDLKFSFFGALAGASLALYMAAQRKMNLAFFKKNFLHIIASLALGLIVAKTIYLPIFSELQFNFSSIVLSWDPNSITFSLFGALVGFAIITLFLASREKRDTEDFWAWFDNLFLSMLAMLIFVHIGYFLAGFEYGLPTSLPWGIAFEADHIPFISPIHPTQLYALILSLFLLAYSVKKSKRIHLSGVVGNRALMLYSLGMFGISFLHGSPSSYSKIMYIALIALGFIGQIHCSHKTHSTS